LSPDLRQRVEEIFEAALDLPAPHRGPFVASATDGDERMEAEVHALLSAHDRAAGMLERAPPPPPPSPAPATPARDRPGISRIGPYRIVGELGRGGMGVVYAAERDDGQFRRRVAIKILRADADPALEARVVSERQILASLDHPSIARLLDGGITEDGRPFLVMEHVDGLPIDTYADRMRLTVPERLRLFNTVARAVQHAHRNLVVHRDLKPSNILITSRGDVKLLDFGIAKLLNPALAPAHASYTGEQRALTPEYASPEQIRGEPLNTASDVYSLGVVLYRLLTACHPYDLGNASMQTIVEVVGGTDPQRPSECVRTGGTGETTDGDGANPWGPPGGVPDHGPGDVDPAAARRTTRDRLVRQLRGDLDAIVLRALRKEPADRYGSAELMAQDIERHLAGLPVEARRGTRGYRFRKFARRHRYQAAAALLVLASLASGAGLAGWQAHVAGRERDRAEEALRNSEEVTEFLMSLFQVSDPSNDQLDEITARDLLQRGLARVEDLNGEPLVQARMLDVIGQVHLHLGDYERAESLQRRSLAGRVSVLGTDNPEVALGMNQLALALRSRAKYDETRALHREALRIQEATLGPADPAVATTLAHMAWVEFDLKERITLLERAVDVYAGALGPDHPDVIGVTLSLANSHKGLGRYAEAESLYRGALASAERHWGPGHPRTAQVSYHLADLLFEHMDQLEEPERLYRRALEIQRRSLGDRHLDQIHGIHSLGHLLARTGRVDEAEALIRGGIDMLTSTFGPSHPRVGESYSQLGGAMLWGGRPEAAEAAYRRALQVWEATLGPIHPTVANARSGLGNALLAQERYDEAGELFQAALEIRRETLGERSIMVGLSHLGLGDVARLQGRPEEARAIYREGLAILRESLPQDHYQVRDFEVRLEAMDLERPAGPTTSGHPAPSTRPG
jgi:serine/threonine protein kinase